MTVIQHLEDLRRALIIASIGWLLATVAAYVVHNQVYLLLTQRAHVPRVFLLSPTAGALLGLFFYLTSEAATYSPADLADWFARAGFAKPKRVRIRRIPNQTLYVTTRA